VRSRVLEKITRAVHPSRTTKLLRLQANVASVSVFASRLARRGTEKDADRRCEKMLERFHRKTPELRNEERRDSNLRLMPRVLAGKNAALARVCQRNDLLSKSAS